MSEIQVTSATLRSKAEELSGLNERFKSEVSSLTEEEGTLRTQFEGQSSDSFHSAFTSDMNQMNTFYGEIAKYVQTLTQIAAEYEKAEAANVATATTRNY